MKGWTCPKSLSSSKVASDSGRSDRGRQASFWTPDSPHRSADSLLLAVSKDPDAADKVIGAGTGKEAGVILEKAAEKIRGVVTLSGHFLELAVVGEKENRVGHEYAPFPNILQPGTDGCTREDR